MKIELNEKSIKRVETLLNQMPISAQAIVAMIYDELNTNIVQPKEEKQ